MNNPKEKMTLDEMRKTPIRTLMKMDMKVLKKLLAQAEKELAKAEEQQVKGTIFSAKLAKDWVQGAINFKLREEGKRRDRRS
jgi:hypothetical protein